MDAESMRILEELEKGAAVREEKGAVLATLVGKEGHAYRKPGAMMLLFPGSGHKIGALSPGCLEDDLMERSARLASPELVRYDMLSPEDAGWGEATGCGGILSVLLEPVDDKLSAVLGTVLEKLRNGTGVSLTRSWSGTELNYAVSSLEEVAERREEEWRMDFLPLPRLVLLGAGDDVIPLSQLAMRCGFQVWAGDWREWLLGEDRFPNAECVWASPGELVERLRIGSMDYVVIASHHMRLDRLWFEALLPVRPRYLGLVGSLKRREWITGGRALPEFVYAPAGISIGSEGPEEIAVSITAELIRCKRMNRPDSILHQSVQRAERWRPQNESDGFVYGCGIKSAHGTSEAAAAAAER